MSATIPPEPHRKALIGSPSNFWLHSSRTGFNLTRPSRSTPSTSPSLTLKTTTTPITISPPESALLIIDMQNFFLSPALGRSPSSRGHSACAQLIAHAIPAARKSGMRVVWLNWGLTGSEAEDLPAGVKRAFGFCSVPDGGGDSLGGGGEGAEVVAGGEKGGGGEAVGVAVDKHGKQRTGVLYKGIGAEMGRIEVDGGWVEGGRLLVRGSWNADLYPPLREVYDEGCGLGERADVWVHKNRMSGLWGLSTPLQEFLEKEGITTLLFAGVNTDQCVGGTLTDAFSKGYDCILLSDGCGTSSPAFAQECWEYNAAHTFGFCCSCEDLAQGVEEMRGPSYD